MRELVATVLVQVAMWIVDLASTIHGQDGEPRDAHALPDPDVAPPQSPITPEAAELLAPPVEHKQAVTKPVAPLRGSVRARREKAATL